MKGSTTLRNNRWLILKTTGQTKLTTDIGPYIEIANNCFNLDYDGLQRFCNLCNEKHGKACPTKIRYDILKNAREGKTMKRKIYSDSCLRQANQLALTSDITCMSGGGLGQLCNLIKYDEKHDEVVLHGGQNEILNSTSRSQFTYTIEKAEEKLRQLAEERNVVLLLPATPTLGSEEDGMKQYLEQKLSSIETIKCVKLDNIEYEGNHPTEIGTTSMIQNLQTAIGEPIILEEAENEITCARMYAQVDATYKVGCRGCDTNEFTQYLCETCVEAAKLHDTTELDEIIRKIEEERYPTLNNGGSTSLTSDQINGETPMAIDSFQGNKRERDSDSDGEGGNGKKSPKNVQHDNNLHEPGHGVPTE